MNTKQNMEYYEDLDESPRSSHRIKTRKRAKIQAMLRPIKATNQTQQMIVQNDSRQTFQFTYRPSRHEEGWLLESLGYFYEHQWIKDVLRVVKGGKEATIYQCIGGPAAEGKPLAAKVYRPRQFRNLKNDQVYRLGREDLDESGKRIFEDGMLKAIHNRSIYGESLRHQSWIAYEYWTIDELYKAGADVPRPYDMGHNAILMEYIGEGVLAAPTLNSIDLEPWEARELLERVLRNIEVLLSHNRIHGDLSAFNILYWDGKITLIDFPQVIDPVNHPLAYRLFRRDVQRVCEYFAGQGVDCNPKQIAETLWLKYGHKIVLEAQPKSPEEVDARNLKNQR